MKVLIIDDENKARRLMGMMLDEHCPIITEQAEAEDLELGVALIKKMKPDIVFLDIEMPQYSGLQILEFFEGKTIDFQIVFVTAYNQYAIDAFKLNAVDYLLKPFSKEDLITAVDKAVLAQEQNKISLNLNALKSSLKQLSQEKIALNVPRGVIFINHSDILYLEADGMYTTFYLMDGSKELICKPLKHFNDQLSKNVNFYSSHRSYLINMKRIKEFNKKDGGHLIMENGKSVPISRYKKDEFLQVIQDTF